MPTRMIFSYSFPFIHLSVVVREKRLYILAKFTILLNKNIKLPTSSRFRCILFFQLGKQIICCRVEQAECFST